MNLSPIQAADGSPIFNAGGRHSYKSFTHRGYVCSLEWVGQGNRSQPCMVIWPETTLGGGMWAIGRKALVDFVGFDANGKCTGGASEHCFHEAAQALPVLGKDPLDRQALLALVDVVVKGAPELVHMPVTPRYVRDDLDNPAMFDVTLSNKGSGKVLAEKSL